METDFAVASVGTTEAAVLEIVREVLARPGLGLDDDVFDNGATSLSFVLVLARINRDLHVTVSAAALAGVATPRNIAVCAGLAPADSKGA
ncbi:MULTISPECIES: acyl carrier protein [Dactylosporangium]|uniref:Carrier domain-containing protein n=2 Tax=Dactylosporangium TaxID=35753 RepID=A0A9W6KQK7_9ACTN|nr:MULTISPECIES: acyl carrier protein [Dactylosporangium]UAB93882.1 acyl carrier protein [Dactylosporangium vinaceum]UWZ42302.1 acyl carrier protein [Dactylosporangium matsuzakiense]GLL05325.1 hypothetical protein GCM10017581_070720 [Dactylosporangium matsuzakiense]